MNLKAQDRALQLLEAAAVCFARRGFHRTTMDEIARAAGVSAGLIYRHYASKDDLVVAMVEQHQQIELAHIAAAAQEPTLAAALDHFFFTNLASNEWRSEALLYAEVIAEALRNERIEAVVKANSNAVSGALAA
ncbi:MAG: TetR/AcrR family transcriptional regulator, partial [Chloroflexales bacterium]|nr:TetR/AcrR family transcriptional regulator [Chloroflexales bacterium]